MVHFESNTHKKKKKFSGRIFNFCFLLQDRSVQSFFFSFFKYILGLVKYTKRKERKKGPVCIVTGCFSTACVQYRSVKLKSSLAINKTK